MICILLQSTILGQVAIRGVRPDLAMLVLVFVSMRRGPMVGQVSGFATGFLEDLMNVSPLGFPLPDARGHRATSSGCSRATSSSIRSSCPSSSTVVATILKGLLAGIVSAIFGIESSGFITFTGRLWIEVGYNGVVAPFLFALLNLFRVFKQADKEGA